MRGLWPNSGDRNTIAEAGEERGLFFYRPHQISLMKWPRSFMDNFQYGQFPACRFLLQPVLEWGFLKPFDVCSASNLWSSRKASKTFSRAVENTGSGGTSRQKKSRGQFKILCFVSSTRTSHSLTGSLRLSWARISLMCLRSRSNLFLYVLIVGSKMSLFLQHERSRSAERRVFKTDILYSATNV